MTKIKPITIEIKEETWNKFKEGIPRIITLNQAVVLLIEKEVKRKKWNLNLMDVRKKKKKRLNKSVI